MTGADVSSPRVLLQDQRTRPKRAMTVRAVEVMRARPLAPEEPEERPAARGDGLGPSLW